MSPETTRFETETAYVLFMDLVGYSRLSMEEQARLVRQLRDIVRGTPSFQRALHRSALIPLDMGDGMALVFFRDAIAPVDCAREIAQALGKPPHLQLRMGIHSGLVNREQDITGKENVTGGGINMAQRIMSCGDAGHILLSKRIAEDLMQFDSWASCIKELGECKVKHDVPVHLYNLLIGEVGNPALPTILHSKSPSQVTAPSAKEAVLTPSVSHGALRIALIYKRNSLPDENILSLLEKELKAQGHQIFIDRHMAIGVEWAMEIERQIRAADAVIALLSENSVRSEMLDYELQTAHKAGQEQNGKPRILPVRIQYTGALPTDSLAAIITPLQYSLWESETDNARLVSEIFHALANPPKPEERPKLEPVGGAVPLDSKFYIVRPTDTEFRTAIARQDSIVLVKGARQMGKTSLLARGLQQAREAGAKVVLTDFQTLNASHFESVNALFLTLGEMIADQLDLDAWPDSVWNVSRGANINLERYLRKCVFEQIKEPIVWGLDEVDRLFSCEFGSEVFGLFRSWHNRRSLDPTGPWSRLTLAIAYATEAHLFITDMNQSPFNVGTRVPLEDMNREQVAELNRRYGQPLTGAGELDGFYNLVSGQPYLVRRGLDDMVSHSMSFAIFATQADRDEGLFGDHLRRILMSLSQDPILTDATRAILRNQPCPTPEAFYRLRSAGIIKGDSIADTSLRCQLYASYLTRHLL